MTTPPPDDTPGPENGGDGEQAKRGRPSKLTPEVARTILEALKLGARREAAAKLAQIAPSTLSGWMSRQDEPYASFAVEVERTEGAVEVKATGLIMQAAQKSPQWAAWWLEHRFPADWGRHRVELTGKDGGPVAFTFDPSSLTDEQLERIAAGEDPAAVVAGAGRAGAPTPGEGSSGALRVRSAGGLTLRPAPAP